MVVASGEIEGEVETFLRRALPHFEAGMTVEQSLRAVLDDDIRLFTAYLKQGKSQYFPTPDERGRSTAAAPQIGDLIAQRLSSAVYSALQERIAA